MSETVRPCETKMSISHRIFFDLLQVQHILSVLVCAHSCDPNRPSFCEWCAEELGLTRVNEFDVMSEIARILDWLLELSRFVVCRQD